MRVQSADSPLGPKRKSGSGGVPDNLRTGPSDGECAETVMPLINLMNDDLLAAPVVQMDETYLQVLKSEKAPAGG